MKKRKHSGRGKPISPAVLEAYKGQPTGFENDTIRDWAFWLSDTELADPALRVVEMADRTGDAAPVIEFVRSNPLTAWGREVIADFFYRTVIRKRTAIYDRTGTEAILQLANDDVTNLMRVGGLSQAHAIEKISREQHIPENTLAKFRRGQHTSSRRMKQRRSSPKSSR